MSERSLRFRLLAGAAMLLLSLICMGARLAFLHLGPHEQDLANIKRNIMARKSLLGMRGSIYDCRGRQNILAMSLTGKAVCVSPELVQKTEKVPEVAAALAQRLSLPAAELAERLSRPDREYEKIMRYVPEAVSADLRAQALPGVFFEDVVMRHYPHGSFLCHVLGFVNHEGVGSAGVEQRFDDKLRGSEGFVEGEVDALRQPVPGRDGLFIPPLPGAAVFLTIDQNLQYTVEKALEQVIAEQRAKSACAIIQRVKTGEILAIASWPAFNLNDFTHADGAALTNRAIAFTYEPGSTLKVVAFSAALKEKLITPETKFDCENGSWQHKGRPLRDYHPYGILTVADGVKKSSNILTAKVAVMLGEQRLYEYLRAFGLGGKLGIDLPGEETGILHAVKNWSGISITRIPIGQGIAVTPLQMLGLYCTVANDGFLMRPYVTDRIVAADGTVLMQGKPKVLGRPIDAETAATMRRLLARVTEDGGTGRKARVEGYEVAGKTGTAQKPENGGYSATKHIGSFVGFLPASAPEIGIIVVVDEPTAVHTGGVVAAPAFSKIAETAVRYLGIPPAPAESGAGGGATIARRAEPKAAGRL